MTEYRLTQYGPGGVASVEADNEHEARNHFATAVLQGHSAGGCRVVGRIVVHVAEEDESVSAPD